MISEFVVGWERLRALASEWNTLLKASRADGIFLTWEWVSAWADVARAHVEPFAVAVRDGQGRLRGLAPLYATLARACRLVPFRVLRVMGDYPTGAAYPDWIVDAQAEEEVLAAIASALARRGRDWDWIWMPGMARWRGAPQRVGRACAAAGLAVRERPAPFSSFALPSTSEAYLKSLSKNKRHSVKVGTTRLRERGARFSRCEEAADIPRYLGRLVELNDLRWGPRSGFRRKPATVRFYEGFAPAALERGWLRLYAVEHEGTMAAVQIGYAYGGTFHDVQEGFDPALGAGAGTALRGHVIERCIAEGLREVDFMSGFNPEKERWLARERIADDLLVTSPRLRNWLPNRLRLWPSGRVLQVHRWWTKPQPAAGV